MNLSAAGQRTDRPRVLVTGGAGFIGCAISEALVALASEVVVLDNLHPQIHASSDRPAALADGVVLHVGDVTDASAWDAVLAGGRFDIVIHLAAETGTGQSLTESSRHGKVNVVGTTEMLDGFTRHGALPSRIVLTSSRAVYGEGAWQDADGSVIYPRQRTLEVLEAGQWDTEGAQPLPMAAATTVPAPSSVYGATKLAQEHILASWTGAFGVDLAVLRLQNVYGPGQSLINSYTGIMALFCRLAREGQSIPLYEDGEMRRDFVLIDDVAAAVIAAAVSPTVSSTAVDIGSGEHQTIASAARILAARYDAPEPHVTGQFRNGDVRHAWADISAARESLGWHPQYDLGAGLARLADWIDAQM